MRLHYINWKKGIGSGAIAGIIWGWIAMGAGAMSGASPFENGLFHNIVIFTIGGAIFGIVAGSFMTLTYDILPFRGSLPKAVLISISLWLILRTGGLLLSSIDANRYHPVMSQNVQGLVLSIILGVCLVLCQHSIDG